MDSDDALISLANMIFSQLSIKKQIKSEEELFSDKVYIDIIGTLIQNIQGEITPGKTPDEKIENIGLLLSILNKLFETEFDIDPKKIIIEKDKESVNSLLELLFEITTTLLNSGAEFEEDDDDLEDRKFNNSDPGMKNEDESVESLRLGKDKKSAKKSGKKSAKKEEKIKMEGLDKEKSQSGEDLFFMPIILALLSFTLTNNIASSYVFGLLYKSTIFLLYFSSNALILIPFVFLNPNINSLTTSKNNFSSK